MTSTGTMPRTAARTQRRSRLDRWSAALDRVPSWVRLGLLWVLVTAYNLAKPYQVDDGAHLEIARWIRDHPLHPMQGLLNWGGTAEPIYDTNQPHLYFYLLAGWSSLFGFGEVAMHALQALFALACVVLFHRLARHFCPRIATWLTALLVLSPAFVVEQNLMVDVPLLAMWLLFFDALLVQKDSPRQTRRFVLAGLACSAAVLTKYSSLALLPVLVVVLLLERRTRQAWTVLVPVAAVAAWSAFNWWDYGGVHLLTRDDAHPGVLRSVRFGAAWVLVIGAITPLGILAATQSSARLRRREPLVLGAVLAGLVLLALAVGTGLVGDRVSDPVLALAFGANGALLLVCLLPPLRRALRAVRQHPAALRRGSPVVVLVLWFLGGTAFYLLLAPFIATRHVLLVLPALLVLFGLCFGERLTRGAKSFALVVTVLVSAGLCLGDWQFASFYRSSAAEVATSLPPTGTVWTTGHWGWQWYSEQQGMRQVDRQAVDLRPGDWLVVAEQADPLTLRGPELQLVRTVDQQQPLLSLFCTGREARFYASGLYGPWSLSGDCTNHLSVYRVVR